MIQVAILVNPYLDEEGEWYQPRRIREELEALGMRAEIVPNAWKAYIGREGVCDALSRFDFCVFLDKEKYSARALEARGMRLFNRAAAVETCDDKVLTHLALAGKVPMPKTLFPPLCYKEKALDVGPVLKALGERVVVKECFGSLGKQVYLAEGEKELAALAEQLKHVPHLYQEFVGESAGRDLRAVCVGGEVVACMERRAEGDFRSNLALGGTGKPVSPTEEVRALSRTVSALLGLDYCGIDFLFGRDGLLVCEVNSNAFFGGIERTTGVNVARAYALYMKRTFESAL